MATQGQRRREAIAAVRQFRRGYRSADTMMEKLERELDRLIKRKTLISVDNIEKVGVLLDGTNQAVEALNRIFANLATIVGNIPR